MKKRTKRHAECIRERVEMASIVPEEVAARAAPAAQASLAAVEVAAIPPPELVLAAYPAEVAAPAAPAPAHAATTAAPAAISVRARLDALEEATGCQLAGGYLQRICALEQMYGVAAPAAGVSFPSRLTAIEQAAGL
jgi:hypothetical protein